MVREGQSASQQEPPDAYSTPCEAFSQCQPARLTVLRAPPWANRHLCSPSQAELQAPRLPVHPSCGSKASQDNNLQGCTPPALFKGATSLWRHNGKDQQVEYPTLGYSPVWRVLERRGEPCLEPTCGGRMEGICRLGGATCTGAAAGCPPIAPGTTGSKRDPAGTTADHSVLSGSESDRHGVHRLYAGGCRHSKPVSPCSALGGAVALGVTSSMPDLQAG